ncbi:MAG TPA: DNRLRE domain-containing protein, partial [Flavobacteriales bacterium]|nr:DNRLRE domain-containing protein [Flavobacteriales bacterium]
MITFKDTMRNQNHALLRLLIAFPVVLGTIIFFSVSALANSSENYIAGQLFVKVNDDSPEILLYQSGDEGYPRGLREIIQKFRVTDISKPFILDDTKLSNTYLVRFDKHRQAQELINEFSRLYFIEYAERVPLYECSLTPNDLHPNQWNLTQIQAEAAWDITTGSSNIVIAVVDDAVLLSHEDLAPVIWVNPGEVPGNSFDDDGNGYIDDINGWDAADDDNDPNPVNPTNSSFSHGTHCAGIAGAATNNSIGIASVSYNVKLMAVKTAINGSGTLPAAYLGVQYAIAANADIISMSWGGGAYSQTYQNLFNTAHGQGIVLIAAAGNSNTSIGFYPAAYNDVISVGATNSSDQKAGFSNYGSTIDVMAPGQDIWSCKAGSNSSYDYLSGTSMACPLVSSLAALMLSWDPSLTPDDLEACLKSSCDNIDAQNPSYIGQIGAGRINAFEAMKCLKAISADFTSDFTLICPGDTVQFTDLTNNNPTFWQWSFPGGFPSSSNVQNPTVIYGSPGTYDVTLIVVNANGTDTLTKTSYITVAVPTAMISGTFNIPAGFNANLRVDLTGSPNWSITYFDGTGNTTINNITNTPYYITVFPASTTTYTLISVTDNSCAGTVAGNAIITVVNGPSNDTICISLQPDSIFGKDASVFSHPSYTNTNYGDHSFNFILDWTFMGTPGTRRSYIEFDLTGIPNSAIILNAKLSLISDSTNIFPYGHSTLSGSNDSYCRRVTQTWNEMTITWNNQPASTIQNEAILPPSTAIDEDYDIDVTALVQDMIDDPANSYGFMLRLITEQYYRSLFFASSDNLDAFRWPKLEICYVAPTINPIECLSIQKEQKISDTQGNFTAILDDTDHFGLGLGSIGDFNGDGIPDMAVSATWDDDGGVNRGALYMLFMNNTCTVDSSVKISATQGGFTGGIQDAWGVGITAIGDLNNDGVTDLAVGEPRASDGNTRNGAVWILFMKANGTVDSHQKISQTQGNFGTALGLDFRFGQRLAYLGDLDGDSIGDIAVGVIGDNDGGTKRGAVWILFLDTNGTVKSKQKISSTAGNFTGTLDDFDRIGQGICTIGDINQDGTVDIAVGSRNDDDGGTDRGAIWIMLLKPDGTVLSQSKISSTQGGFTGSIANGVEFGIALSNIGDLDGNGADDLLVGSHGDDDGGVDRGAAWILYLNNDATVKSHFKISSTQGGFNGPLDDGDIMGWDLVNAGDIDGDGSPEIALGAARDDDGGTDRGGVWIISIKDTCSQSVPSCVEVASDQKISDVAGSFTGILDNEDWFGYAVCDLGDLNNDGINDMAVGAHQDGDGGSLKGAVWILFLNADGTTSSYQKISDTQGNFTGTLDISDKFAVSLANLGDLDGDGNTDIAVGAHLDDDGGSNRGAVWILFLDSNGTVKSHQKISSTQGNFSGPLSNEDRFGHFVSEIGDLNNDGIEDLAVGAYDDDDGGTDVGAVWILFLDSNGTVKSSQKISALQGNFTGTLDNLDRFCNVGGIGDINGDNIVDLAVGAFNDDDGGTDRGAVWILFLDTNGTVSSHQKISDTQGAFTGVLDNSDSFGRSVAGMGDLNQDGTPDIMVGTASDDDGGTDRGAARILYLNPDGTVNAFFKISDTQSNFSGALANSDLFGVDIANLGDLNSDGNIEVAIGAFKDDDGGTNRGAVWILSLEDSCLVVPPECNITANFSADTACLGDTTSFTDLSIDSLNNIIIWKWYYGDGDSTIGVQNPKHIYNT